MNCSKFVAAIRKEMEVVAAKSEVLPRDMACTFLFAAIGTTHALYGQVGDGAIVTTNNGEREVVFWPESGEYANMTRFVTDEDADAHLRSTVRAAPNEIAVFTDGLQRLALQRRAPPRTGGAG